MDKGDLTIARHFKKLLQARLTPIEVRIFGSRARGNASLDSDLDMFIVVEHATPDIGKYISNCAWEAGFEKNIVIVPVVISRDKLAGAAGESAFIRNVYREGIAI